MPKRIGTYRILEAIGEGGMGIVYRAEKTAPVRRIVAIKVIKLGMDSKEIVARFEAEAQAMALMNHPNIARGYEAGVTVDARPYFVMEYVPGVPLTEHCDRQRLTTRERLKLFLQVCDAVGHAHQKGIIHRDIKPSNVLVIIDKDKVVPKVIDFGVAKAMNQRLTEKTLFTGLGQIIGTPEYMSPEQAEMTAQDIDTRSDIYSLGVLLYELLVGILPFEPRELRSAGFVEMQRMIREKETLKPSTRLSNPEADASSAARNRRTDVRTLLRQLHGDLDWITMKAMEKDRARRYATASEFAADVTRHLEHQPIEAGPPGIAYRLRKFVRRNRIAVTAGCLVGAALVVGLALATYGFIRASRGEALAIREAGRAEAVMELIREMFSSADPSRLKGSDYTVRELLDDFTVSLSDRQIEDPEVKATVFATIGETYKALGQYNKAERMVRRALDIRRVEFGVDHSNTLEAMDLLALVYRDQGRFSEAEKLAENALEIRRSKLGREHLRTQASMCNLGLIYRSTGRYADAEEVLTEALDLMRRTQKPEHPYALSAANNLALVYWSQGRYAEAEPLWTEVLEARRRLLGEEHPKTLISMNNLAALYLRQMRYGDAERLQLKALEIRRRVLGETHAATLRSMVNLGSVYREQGHLTEAERLLERATGLFRETLGGAHPNTLMAESRLASLYRKQGRVAEAEKLYVNVLETGGRVLGRTHPDTLSALEHLASTYLIQGRGHDAEVLLRECLELRERNLPQGDWRIAGTKSLLGESLAAQRKLEEAEPLLLDGYAGLKEAAQAPEQPRIEALERLVEFYEDSSRPRTAEKWRQALEETGEDGN